MQTFSIDKNFDCVKLDRDFEIVNLSGKYKKEEIWSALSSFIQFQFVFKKKIAEVVQTKILQSLNISR
jgi:hypothetical protein